MAYTVKVLASMALFARVGDTLSMPQSLVREKTRQAFLTWRETQHSVDNFEEHILNVVNADYSNVQTQSCEVWADPHVSGFDNTENQGPSSLSLLQQEKNLKKVLQRTAVESHVSMSSFVGRPVDVNAYESGDFWLVKSEPIYIQGRFRLSGEFKPDRAAIGAVAIGGPFLKKHKLIVEPLDGQVSFDGKILEDGVFQLTKNGGSDVVLSVHQDGHGGVEAQLPMNVKLLFRRMAKHVDVKITMPKIKGGVDGECGNNDGIAENDDEQTVQDRMGAMMVDDNMLLFPKEAKDKNGHTDRMVDSEGVARGEGFSNVKQQAQTEAKAEAEAKKEAIVQAKTDAKAEKQAKAEAAALAKAMAKAAKAEAAAAKKANADAMAAKQALAEAAAMARAEAAKAKGDAQAEKQARAEAAAMAKAAAAAAKAEAKEEAEAQAEADREAKAEQKAEVIAAAEARKEAAEEAKAEQKAAEEAAAEEAAEHEREIAAKKEEIAAAKAAHQEEIAAKMQAAMEAKEAARAEAAQKKADEKARAEAQADHEREVAAKKEEIAAARAAHQEEKAARLQAAMEAKEEARAAAAELGRKRAAKKVEIAAIKDAHQQEIAAKMEAAKEAKEDARVEAAAKAQAHKEEIAAQMEAAKEAKEEARAEYAASAQARKEEIAAKIEAAAETRAEAAAAKAEAKDEAEAQAEADREAKAEKKAEDSAAAEARKEAADEAKEAMREEIAAEHQANADARNEIQAAKQDSRDATLHVAEEWPRMAAADQRIQAAMQAEDLADSRLLKIDEGIAKLNTMRAHDLDDVNLSEEQEDTRLQKIDEGIAKLQAMRQELVEARTAAVHEVHDADVAAKMEANADARNEMQAAKQDTRDATLHKSESGQYFGSGSGFGSGGGGGGSGSGGYGGSGSGSGMLSEDGVSVQSGGDGGGSGSGCQTQSCEVWADPHVSGFDNADNQGPQSLALLALNLGGFKSAFNSALDSRARFYYGGAGAGDIAYSIGMNTFDKRPVDLNAYDTGDFWLVKSDPVHIQGRFRLSGEFIPDKAAIGAIAVGGPFLQGHKLVVEPLDGTITLDGKAAPVGSWSHKSEDGKEELISLMDDGHGSILAELPMGISLFLRRLDKHVDIKITMPEIEGGIDGECGNYDGIAENDVETDIQDRMGGLRVDGLQMLFDKPFDQSEPLLKFDQ